MSMYSAHDLAMLVEKHLGWLQDSFGIKITRCTDWSVDMTGNGIALRVLFSPDLPRLVYLHAPEQGKAIAFDLWKFLGLVRGSLVANCCKTIPHTASIAESNDLMLEVLSCALRAVGGDILSGDSSWMASYPGTPEEVLF